MAFALRVGGSNAFLEKGVTDLDVIDGTVEGWDNPEKEIFSSEEEAQELLDENPVYGPAFSIEEVDDPDADPECDHCGKVIDKPGFCSRGCYRADQAGL